MLFALCKLSLLVVIIAQISLSASVSVIGEFPGLLHQMGVLLQFSQSAENIRSLSLHTDFLFQLMVTWFLIRIGIEDEVMNLIKSQYIE